MNLLTQIQTPQGNLPVKRARCVIGNTLCESWIEFEFVRDVRGQEQNSTLRSDNSLANLAFLSDADGRIDHELIEKVATQTEPIFGANARESVADWVSASNMAKDVLRLQEVINGVKPYSILCGASCLSDYRQFGAVRAGETDVNGVLKIEESLELTSSGADSVTRSLNSMTGGGLLNLMLRV